MTELDRDILTVFIETYKFPGRGFDLYLPAKLLQDGGHVTFEATPVESQPRILVQKDGWSKPKPLIVGYYHDDSDDDDYAVEPYEITSISGFFIDPESREPIYVLRCQNDGSVPHVEPGFIFFQLEDIPGKEDSDLIPITIFDQQSPCHSIGFDLKG